jgi:hypothetical protein
MDSVNEHCSITNLIEKLIRDCCIQARLEIQEQKISQLKMGRNTENTGAHNASR